MTYYPPQGVVRWGYGIHPPQGVRVVPVVPPPIPPPIPSLSKTVAGKLFEDDFEAYALAKPVYTFGDWTAYYEGTPDADHYWAIVAGKYVESKDSTVGLPSPRWGCIYGAVSASDSVIQFKMKWVSGGYREAGGALRFADVNNLYFFFQSRYDNTMRFYKRIGGVVTKVASVAFTPPGVEWHTYAFQAKGTSLKIYYDGSLILSTTDPDLTSGKMGLLHAGEHDDLMQYDDFKAYKDLIIKVTSLQEGQKVELYDSADTLVDSKTVGAGETSVSLDVSGKVCYIPFDGYFKVYRTDGVTLWYTYPKTGNVELWGGDEYQQS